jgi:hypothetical protein
MSEAEAWPKERNGFFHDLRRTGYQSSMWSTQNDEPRFCVSANISFCAVLAASVAAFGTTALLMKRSILTERIARRGLHLTREYGIDPFLDTRLLTLWLGRWTRLTLRCRWKPLKTLPLASRCLSDMAASWWDTSPIA